MGQSRLVGPRGRGRTEHRSRTLTAAALSLLLTLALLGAAPSATAPAEAATSAALEHLCPADEVPTRAFEDATGPHGAAIDCLAELDIVQGRTTDVFATTAQVTRGELASLVARALAEIDEVELPDGTDEFSDIAGNTHAGAITRLAATQPAVLRGYDDGTFRPTHPIRRDQAAAALARAHHLVAEATGADPLPDDPPVAFADLDRSVHAADVTALAAAGIVAGRTPTRFAPDATLTRGQAASLLARHLDLLAEAGVLDPAPDDPEDPDDPFPDSDNVWLTDRRVANIAHAGGLFEAPQNTLYAFATAPGRGADVLEMDLHVTADGEIVVIHDSTVDRTTDGTGCVVDHTLEELRQLDAAHTHVDGQGPVAGLEDDAYLYRGIATGEVDPPEGFTSEDFRVPTLAEVFDRFGDMPMVIEIKPIESETRDGVTYDCPEVVAELDPDERPDPVAEVARLIDEHDMVEQVMVASFIDDTMHEFNEVAPHAETSFPLLEGLQFYMAYEDGNEPTNPRSHVAMQAPTGLEFGGVQFEMDEGFVEFANEHDVAVHFWTVNDEDEMALLLDWGADGIITDRVSTLEQLLTDRGDPRPTGD